ncbi:MAG: NAD-dependent epimerase/dehydratase family protein [Pseudomonadota bacterium]
MRHPTLIVGAGYIGTRLITELSQRGVNTLAAVSRERSAARLKKDGIQALCIDLDDPSASLELPLLDSVVYLVPPRRDSDDDTRFARLLDALPDCVSTVLYVSTTGVYGDQQGRRVDETCPPAPQSGRAHRRLNAERLVQQHCEAHDRAWFIARVPGIYGPGRLPLQSIAERRPIIQLSEANPGNRIHRDDLAFSLADLLTLGRDGALIHRIYNIGDNHHMSGSQFTLEVARLADLTPPPQISREQMKASASAIRWSFLAESRRLDSRRLTAVLTKPLRYADPVDGICASLEAPDDPAA